MSDAALRDQRLRDRSAKSEAVLDAEDNTANMAFGIEYKPKTLSRMLVAYRDEYGNIPAMQQQRVRAFFARREAWQLGTLFCNAWCTIVAIRCQELEKHGWTEEQIEAQNRSVGPHGLDKLALLFHVLRVPAL